MVLDTSSLVAILLGERDAPRLVEAIASDSSRLVGAPTLVEATAVMLARKGPRGQIALDALLARVEVEIVPMTPDAAAIARSAYSRFGRGVGSPGVLSFGDCLAYGAAMASREPLLFTGDDFARTDVAAVTY